MLWSSNFEVSLLTTRATNAKKMRSSTPLKNFGWVQSGIMNMSHCLPGLIDQQYLYTPLRVTLIAMQIVASLWYC